ncbi:amidohydrolase family protein [Burkholderia gladioli]|uniref:amidohydrolase family protein n=2 Tax=Burkholderia gladioli TaxID=28095 RepID=UPI0031334B50
MMKPYLTSTSTLDLKMTSGSLIDVHHHALLPSIVGTPKIPNVDIPIWDVDSSVRMMDKFGIKAAILSLSAPGIPLNDQKEACLLARRVNEHFASIIEKYPSRFGAFAALPIPFVDEAVRELDYAVNQLGLDGVGLFSNYAGSYLGAPKFDPIFEFLNDKSVTAHIHPTMAYGSSIDTFELPPSLFEFTFDTTRAVAQLVFNGVLGKYKKLKLIVSHAGGTIPYLAKRLTYGIAIQKSLTNRQPADVIGQLKSLYYDTAVCGNPHALSCLSELVGPDHILFGSDFPYLPLEVLEENQNGLMTYDGFTREDLEIIAHGNISALFPAAAKRFGLPVMAAA